MNVHLLKKMDVQSNQGGTTEASKVEPSSLG